jgi:predicted ArsR family transcriptional regulator
VASLPPRAVIGPEALAALAVPARLAILNHLLAAGPRTASQCAPVVGESASNCSWHLRALAKVGLVERVTQPAGDGRTRPWQATAVGFELSEELGPAADVARAAFAGIEAEHADELYRRYLARRELLPAEWTRVSGANGYALELTPDELEALVERLDAAIRPYVRPIRDDAPEGSAVVQVTLRAFLNPDVG